MRRILGVATLAVVALSVVLIGAASAAKPPPTTASGCPQGGTYLVDPNVGASASGDTTRTYTFHSWTDENPVNGIPGLVGYCVYTNQTASAVTIDPNAKGDNGQVWKTSKAGQSFSFLRPGGEKSNIGLDGTDTLMGTATFPVAMTGESFLLHVSDAETCQDLYGGDATTCFVLPGPKPGPICDAGSGNTDAAYNAIPTDVVHCGPPALGFESDQTNEFGDLVQLSGSGDLQSMRVDFQSFGCSTSGHWNTGDCETTNFGTDTFTVPGGITAHIYAVDTGGAVGQLIATSTENPQIPYRPSADGGANCANPGQWYDPFEDACHNSWSVPITFDNFTFPNGTHSFADGEQVIWTVQFNTSTEGYNPIGPCGNSDPGCGYDSLNVGAKTYATDAFAGTDVDVDVAYRSWNSTPGDTSNDLLIAQAGWAANRPLGEIVLGP